MRLVVDANVVLSALIADSKTREVIGTLEPNLTDFEDFNRARS
jgi:predicted nucleic acid-binding protein